MNNCVLFDKVTGMILMISNQVIIPQDNQIVKWCNDISTLHYLDLKTKEIKLWSLHNPVELDEVYKNRIPQV